FSGRTPRWRSSRSPGRAGGRTGRNEAPCRDRGGPPPAPCRSAAGRRCGGSRPRRRRAGNSLPGRPPRRAGGCPGPGGGCGPGGGRRMGRGVAEQRGAVVGDEPVDVGLVGGGDAERGAEVLARQGEAVGAVVAGADDDEEGGVGPLEDLLEAPGEGGAAAVV